MKLLKNPILWLVIIVFGVSLVGYKYMIKTSQLQQKIQYEKVKKILRKKSYNLYGLEKISSKELWAVGSQGMILHSTDGGIEWQERQIMDPEQVFASISFSDSSNAWIVGNQGCILHSSDQGQTWKKVTVPEVKDYYKIYIYNSLFLLISVVCACKIIFFAGATFKRINKI
jgi:hypothetical protein